MPQYFLTREEISEYIFSEELVEEISNINIPRSFLEFVRIILVDCIFRFMNSETMNIVLREYSPQEITNKRQRFLRYIERFNRLLLTVIREIREHGISSPELYVQVLTSLLNF